MNTHASNDIRWLSEGSPALMGTLLPPECFVPMKARRLARACVLWLNFDLLRQSGISFPKEGLTPEYEKLVLEAFAWAVPQPYDHPSFFTADEKDFFADRYGGEGLESNWGSGRAASAGRIQIKGIGRTPLVGTDVKEHHSHGGLPKFEALAEAIWGEVNYRDLPCGEGRVLALIDPGTTTIWKDGGRESKALVVRFDIVRPAHFMTRGACPGDALPAHKHHLDAEHGRVPAALALLAKNIPGRTLTDGLKEFARRIGQHNATMFARGFYHGTTTPSNRAISGGIIDFGTQTAQPGFGRIFVLPDVAPAGCDMEEIREMNDCFLDSMAASGLPTAGLPSKEELARITCEAYRNTLQCELLCLTGLPRDAVFNLAGSSEARQLADWLLLIASDGCARTDADKEMPCNPGRYDLRKILVALAGNHDLGTAFCLQTLGAVAGPPAQDGALASDEKRSSFCEAYSKFAALATAEALMCGWPGTAQLRKYVIHNARHLNRVLTGLFRNNMRLTNHKLLEAYHASGNRPAVWDSINGRIDGNTTFFKNPRTFAITLASQRDPLFESSLEYYFDAAQDCEFISLELPPGGINDCNLVLSQAGKLLGSSAAFARGRLTGFDVPLPEQAQDTQKLDLHLLAADGKRLRRFDLNILLQNRKPLPPESLSSRQLYDGLAAPSATASTQIQIAEDEKKSVPQAGRTVSLPKV